MRARPLPGPWEVRGFSRGSRLWLTTVLDGSVRVIPDPLDTEEISVTDTEQAEPARRGHVLDAILCIRVSGLSRFEPDRVTADTAAGLIEIVFDSSPTAVAELARALGFPPADIRPNHELGQVVMVARGEVVGWAVEIRHVRTSASSVLRGAAVAAR